MRRRLQSVGIASLLLTIILTSCQMAVEKPPRVSLLVVNFETQSDDGLPWGVLYSRILADKINFAPDEIIRSPFYGWIEQDIKTLYGEERTKTGLSRREAIQLARVYGIRNVMTGILKKHQNQIEVRGEIFDLETSATITAFNLSDTLEKLPDLLSQSALETLKSLGMKLPRKYRKYIGRRTPKDYRVFEQAMTAYLIPAERSSEAAELWKKITDKDPEFTFAYVELVNRIAEEDPLNSYFTAEKAYQKFPHHGRIHQLYIGTLYDNKRYQKAVEECQKFLKENPDNPRVMWLMAFLYKEQENYKDAVETLKQASLRHPCHWIMQYDCAWLALQWAYSARKGRYFSQLSSEEKQIFRNGVELALKKLLTAVEIYPQNGKIWTLLIDAYKENGYPISYAEQAFERAYKLIPHNLDAYRNLLWGYSYGYDNNPDKARTLIRRVAGDYPDDPEVYMTGVYFWRHMLRHNPSLPEYCKEEIRWLANKAVELGGLTSKYASDSLYLLVDTKNYEQAYSLAKKILDNPDGWPEQFQKFPHEIYRWAGESARKLGDYDNALRYYQLCIDNKPCRACGYESVYGMGRIYGMRGEYDKAFGKLEQATRVNPENDSAYITFAYFAVKSGKELQKGLEFARKATQLNPYKADNWRVLSQVYDALGQKDKALTAIDRAIRLKPNSDAYKKLKEKYLRK